MTPSTTVAGVTGNAANIVTDCGVGCFTGSTQGAIQGDPNPPSGDQYFEYGFTVNAGNSVTLSAVAFTLDRSNSGFDDYSIDLYVNGALTTNISSGSLGTGNNVSFNLPVTNMIMAGQTATIRITVSNYLGSATTCPSGSGGTTRVEPPFTISGTVLPVELVYFKAQYMSNQQMDLSWATASETNNEKFVLEHRSPGSDQFEPVAEIDGNGTTNVPQYYNHQFEVHTRGFHYFRLKQMDYDGTFDYSPIKSVHVSDIAADDNMLKIVPNPVSSHVTFVLDNVEIEEIDFQLYSTSGQLVIEKTGFELYKSIDLSYLETGVYVVKLITPNKIYSEPLTILQ